MIVRERKLLGLTSDHLPALYNPQTLIQSAIAGLCAHYMDNRPPESSSPTQLVAELSGKDLIMPSYIALLLQAVGCSATSADERLGNSSRRRLRSAGAANSNASIASCGCHNRTQLGGGAQR